MSLVLVLFLEQDHRDEVFVLSELRVLGAAESVFQEARLLRVVLKSAVVEVLVGIGDHEGHDARVQRLPKH